MARVKRGVTSHAKHKKVYKATKGYYGRRKNTIRIAKQAVEKAMQYAYRDRKRRKRTFRALWIQRINAAVRPFGLNYRRSSTGWPRPASMVDRKVLSDLAIREPAAFQAIVEKAKAALPASLAHASQRCHAGLGPASTLPVTGLAARDGRDKPGHDAAETGAMSDIAQLETDLLAAIAAATDEAALEAVRVSALGKSGSVSALLKTLGAHDAGRAQGAGPGDQRPEGPRQRGARRAQGRARAARRSTPGSPPRPSTSRCRCARRRPRPAASIRSAR